MFALLSWKRASEIDKSGNIIGFYLGIRYIAFFMLAIYLHFVYDLLFDSDDTNFLSKIFFTIFFTIVFALPVPYILTRKILITDHEIKSYSFFTGKKIIDLKKLQKVEYSKKWGSFVAYDPTERVVIDSLISGCDAIVEHLEKNTPNRVAEGL